MTEQLAPFPVFRAWDNLGLPLFGGKLFTYVAGTTTKQASYTDSTGGTPNTNPVILNFRGEAQVWLDPTKVYKLVLAPATDTDPPTNPFWTVDNISGGSASPSFSIIPTVDNLFTLGNTSFSWANVYVGPNHAPVLDGSGNIGYIARTPAEISASVTPVNFAYLPGVVDRYGTNANPGTTDMTTAFQAAVNQSRKLGGAKVTYGYTGLYLLTSPIDCTFTGSANQQGVTIEGIGGSSQDQGHGLFANHNGNCVLDFTGCDSAVMRDVNIYTNVGLSAANCPKYGILWARNITGGSTFNRLYNVKITGSYGVACLYNYGCEDNIVTASYFANYCTSNDTSTRIYTATNIKGAVSTFTTIYNANASNTDHTSLGNQDLNAGGQTHSDCIYLEGVDGFASFGGWAHSASASAVGRALFFIDQSAINSARISIYGLKGEVSGLIQQYGVLTNNVGILTGLTVDGCFLPNSIFAMAASGVTIVWDNVFVRGVSEQTSHGISVPGTLQNSLISSSSLALSIGNSTKNTLIGWTEQWAITTRTNDTWIDSGSTNKTWTPALGTVTHGGVLNINETRFQYNGNCVDFETTISDSVSLTATAGQTIVGLPVAALRRSASVQVANEGTKLAIGSGFIEAGTTTINCPAFSVGANVSVTISGRYFVA